MGFRALSQLLASTVLFCAVIVCSVGALGATEKTHATKNEDEVEVAFVVLTSEMKANDWTKTELICFSVNGQYPSSESVKSLRQRGLNVRSSAEWAKKFNCGFEVQLEYSGFDSQSVKVRSNVVDLREINKRDGDLALLRRAGEYSLKKNDGRWSIQEYVAKQLVVGLDHSDWWSILNEDVPELNLTAHKAAVSRRNFTIAGVSLEKDDPKQVENKLGRVKSVKRGDASSGREQLCYVSSNDAEKLYLIFEYGEVNATFYLFAGGQSWHGSESCASSERISKALSTSSGLRLGLTRKQVETILGKPDAVVDDRFVYFRETERRTTADEFERFRRDYPRQLSDKDAHEKFDVYTVQTYIETRFTGSGLNYLVVSTSATD